MSPSCLWISMTFPGSLCVNLHLGLWGTRLPDWGIQYHLIQIPWKEAVPRRASLFQLFPLLNNKLGSPGTNTAARDFLLIPSGGL